MIRRFGCKSTACGCPAGTSGATARKIDAVGAASAATLCVIEDEGSGRKPLLQKPAFCRSGFRRDPCVIENRRFGSKDHGSSSPISNVGQLPAVALLEPHGATRGRRRPLSFSDHSRTCAGPFSTLQRFLSLARCRIAQMVLRRILPLEGTL
jgi:hypothetical protein